MSDALTDVRFWAQVMADSKRTVLCSPENDSRCKGYVDARGLAGLITVLASPAVPDDTLIVIDPGAIEASLAQSMQRYRPTMFDYRTRRFPPYMPPPLRITNITGLL